MNILVRHQSNNLVIAPAGRLDSVNAPILDQKLTSVIERGETRLVIDLSAIDYISSKGLAALLSAAKKLRLAEGRFVLAGIKDPVRTVMEISGLNKIFTIFPNVEAAVLNS